MLHTYVTPFYMSHVKLTTNTCLIISSILASYFCTPPPYLHNRFASQVKYIKTFCLHLNHDVVRVLLFQVVLQVANITSARV